MTSLAMVTTCTLAQRPTKEPRVCVCGTSVYGASELDPVRACALCALRADLKFAAEFDVEIAATADYFKKRRT